MEHYYTGFSTKATPSTNVLNFNDTFRRHECRRSHDKNRRDDTDCLKFFSRCRAVAVENIVHVHDESRTRVSVGDFSAVIMFGRCVPSNKCWRIVRSRRGVSHRDAHRAHAELSAVRVHSRPPWNTHCVALVIIAEQKSAVSTTLYLTARARARWSDSQLYACISIRGGREAEEEECRGRGELGPLAGVRIISSAMKRFAQRRLLTAR